MSGPRAARSFSGAFSTVDLFLQDIAHVQTPQLFAVDCGDGAVDLGIDDLILHRRAMLDQIEKRRAKQHGDVLALGKNAFVLDPKGAPDIAAAAVAADQIVSLDDFFFSGFDVNDGREHPVGCLLEGFEFAAITQFDLRQ